MIVLIGAEPPTRWLAGELALDPDGFILTGPDLEPGIAQAEPVAVARPRTVPGRDQPARRLRDRRRPLRVDAHGRARRRRRRHGRPLRRSAPRPRRGALTTGQLPLADPTLNVGRIHTFSDRRHAEPTPLPTSVVRGAYTGTHAVARPRRPRWSASTGCSRRSRPRQRSESSRPLAAMVAGVCALPTVVLACCCGGLVSAGQSCRDDDSDACHGCQPGPWL
jgi:hypothetical protein